MDESYAVEGLKQYPWLRDFCSYIDIEQNEWLDYYLIHAETIWINKLAKWKMDTDAIDTLTKNGFDITKWNSDDGVPTSLKIELFHVFEHLSGDSHDLFNRFKEWYGKNYHNTSIQKSNTIGKKILNEYRLAYLEYHSVVDKDVTRTPEKDYMFEIANAVSAEHGFDEPIDEEIMCRALAFADKHGYKIEIVPNKADVIANIEYGCHYHPEFKEIRIKALEAIKNHPCYDRVELIDYTDEVFTFEAYNSKGVKTITDSKHYLYINKTETNE